MQDDIAFVKKDCPLSVEEYIEIRGEEIVQSIPDDDMILRNLCEAEEDVQEEIVVQKVSSSDAYKALETLRIFYEQQDIDTSRFVRTVSALQSDHEKLVLQLRGKAKQTHITHFFSTVNHNTH